MLYQIDNNQIFAFTTIEKRRYCSIIMYIYKYVTGSLVPNEAYASSCSYKLTSVNVFQSKRIQLDADIQ